MADFKRLVGSQLVDKWEEEQNLILLRGWARDGFTRVEIAEKMHLAGVTLSKLMKKSALIRGAIEEGSEVTDYKVENALLKAALGFDKKEVRITTVIKGGVVVETRKEVLNTQQAPNVYACQSWLFNRRPDKWCKNPENKLHIGEDDTVSIVITKAGNDETGTRPAIGMDVNKSVTVRGMSEDERAAQSQKAENNTDDLDYWPDDWSED